ncbi:hypothetical protein HN588_16100, partial [Candidatus Bathyarchaeota archaeon]|nr:hypothetical protein [Candidatus Bathyarchaeota archaeon]
TPTEVFVEKDGRRKFRAVELNNDMGVHIKTTQACADDDGTERGPGEEIFITGKKQKIYWPKPEHAVVKYGDDDTGVTFAIAIPDGEGKYALQKATGNVVLIRGHQMFLPDPTQEVVVQRVLDPAVVELLYPDNAEAMAFNDRLRASRVGAAPIELPRLRRGSHKGLGLSESYIEDELGMPQNFESLSYSRSTAPVLEQAVGDGFGGDEISRKTSHTPPREITLDNKYTGAVAVDVWPNFCILLVTKKGERRTVVGPKTVLLDYDEVPASLELSTETPKTDAHTLRTAYLQIEANKVSDEIHAETSDMVKVRIKLSYRVNFEGDNKRWFNMRNYVKVLTDHLRSLVQCLVSRHGIAEFQKNARDIIRNAILGEKPAEGDRPGRSFSENGMRVYEVDFDTIEVRDQSIAARLVEAQHSAVTRSIEISDAEGDRETNARLQEIQREKQRDADVTAQEAHKLRLEAAGRSQEADLLSVEHSKATQLANIQADSEAAELQATAKLVAQDAQDVIADKIRDSKMKDASQRLEIAEHDQNLQVDLMEKEVAAVVAQAGAISPRLVAAMETMGTKKLAEELVVALGPEAIASGQSVVSVLKKLVGDGTVSTLLDGLFKGFKSDAVNSSTDSGAE